MKNVIFNIVQTVWSIISVDVQQLVLHSNDTILIVVDVYAAMGADKQTLRWDLKQTFSNKILNNMHVVAIVKSSRTLMHSANWTFGTDDIAMKQFIFLAW